MENLFFLTGILIQSSILIFTLSFVMYAWRKREMSGSTSFLLWMAAISGWLVVNLINMMPIQGLDYPLLYRLMILFQGLLPGAILLFSLQFTGRHRWFTSGRQLFLFVFPAIFVYFGWTHPSTALLWNNYQLTPSGSASYSFGWLYLLFWLYFYFCLWIAARVIISFGRHRGKHYPNQIKLMVISIVFPSLFILFSIFWPAPITINHLLPIGFSLSALLVGFSIYQYKLFDLPTLTYHTLLENFQDGLVIFDRKERLVFVNLTAQQLLGIDDTKFIGRQIDDIISAHSVWMPVLREESVKAIVLSEAGETHYEAEVVLLPKEEGKWKQKLIIVRDITKAYQAEQAEKEARTIAENRAMELDVLRIIAEKLNRLAGFNDVTEDGLKEIVSRLGARFGYVILANHNNRPYTAGSYHLPPVVDAAFKKYSFCPSCKIFEKFMHGDYLEPVSFLPCAVLDEYAISYPGLISIPLRLAERQIGVLNLVMAPNAVFSGDEIRLMQTIGDQYSAALERARLYEEAEKMATLDPLTELYNRRYFFELAHEEFERARRYQHHLSIIMLDIDLFKNVNDTYGHLVGDQVLQTIAERCRSVLRSSDKIGRYGGEEFVMILPETNIEMAEKTATRIRSVVSDRQIIVENAKISVTVSLGVASTDLEFKLELEQMLEQADQALYRAKQTGRYRVNVWSDPFVVQGLFSKKMK